MEVGTWECFLGAFGTPVFGVRAAVSSSGISSIVPYYHICFFVLRHRYSTVPVSYHPIYILVQARRGFRVLHSQVQYWQCSDLGWSHIQGSAHIASSERSNQCLFVLQHMLHIVSIPNAVRRYCGHLPSTLANTRRAIAQVVFYLHRIPLVQHTEYPWYSLYVRSQVHTTSF